MNVWSWLVVVALISTIVWLVVLALRRRARRKHLEFQCKKEVGLKGRGILQQMRDASPAIADIHFNQEWLDAFELKPGAFGDNPRVLFRGAIYERNGRVKERVDEEWVEVEQGSPRWFELRKEFHDFLESAKNKA